MTTREFARLLAISPEECVATLVSLGIMKAVNQTLSVAEMRRAAEKRGVQVVVEAPAGQTVATIAQPLSPPRANDKDLKHVVVPPVVTVLGHVDHGKTTLLDAIRRTNVTAREQGGITQHIGASEVEHQGKRIVFLDTPGHEAFTALRARGAQVTDLALLVVAADDGVMPQTLEALQHIRAAKVPVIVVVNKIDKEQANPQQVRTQLSEHGLVPEEWGGDTIYVEVSAKLGLGLDTLLDMILLVAELQELKAPVNVPGEGVVIESRLDPTRGPVATVLVKQGRLRKGDFVCAGQTSGKVRKMTDWLGQAVEVCGPGRAVEVWGLTAVPPAGCRISVIEDSKRAKAWARQLKERAKREAEASGKPSVPFFLAESGEGTRELRLVLKADAQGSLEAVTQAVCNLPSSEVRPRFLYQGIGNIGETDVLLAAASQAVVLGFGVRADWAAQRLSRQERVEVRTHGVIYELVEDVRRLMEGLLEPLYREVVVGRAEVRPLFRSTRAGTIAVCYFAQGRMLRGAPVRIVRQGEQIWDGLLTSLRRFKDDVREVEEGFECGIVLEGFQDFQEGDLIECYQQERVARTLS